MSSPLRHPSRITVRARARARAVSALLGGLAALAGLLLVVVGWSEGPAAAHAQLLAVTPANDEVVDEPPRQVELEFTEAVSLTGASIRVLDDAARPVSGEPVPRGDTIIVPLSGALADGTYTVTYVVVSVDSHRISGASVFHVGAPSASAPVGIPDMTTQAGWGVRVGAAVLTSVGYAGALVACGVLALTIYGDRSRPLGTRPGDTADGDGLTARWDAAIVRAAVLAAVALVAAAPFRIARLGGGLDALRDDELIRSSLGGPVGQSTALGVVALFAVAVAIDQRAPGWLGALCGAAALASFGLEGHTRAARRALMTAADTVHLVAGAVWVGGLAGLLVAFRATPSPSAIRLAGLARRFSNAAVASVVVVSAVGALMTWVVLPSFDEVTSTGWGLALIVKVGLVAAVVALGAYNNRRLVRSRLESDAGARRWLTRLVSAEALLLIAAVAVTAVLVTRSPVQSGGDGSVPVLSAHVELGDGAGSAEVTVAPGRVGANRVHVVLRDGGGGLLDPVDAPEVELVQVELGVGPLPAEMRARGVGEFEGDAQLAHPGEWRLLLRVRVSDFESTTGDAVLTIHE